MLDKSLSKKGAGALVRQTKNGRTPSTPWIADAPDARLVGSAPAGALVPARKEKDPQGLWSLPLEDQQVFSELERVSLFFSDAPPEGKRTPEEP